MPRSSRIYLLWVGTNDEPEAAFTVKYEAVWYLNNVLPEEDRKKATIRAARDGGTAEWVRVEVA